MIFLRKSVWPLREAISSMERGESPLIGDSVGPYLRDVYDHTIQVIDTVETFRDTISGTLDIYLSSLSNKMNEVMKVLDHYCHHFYSPDLYCGCLRHEFQVYARTGMEVGLSGDLDRHTRTRMPDVVRLQTEEVAVKGQKMAKPAKSKIKRKRVTLTLEAPNAEAFWLMGDFNQWNQKAHPMKQEGDGLDPCKKGFFGRHPLGQFDGRVMNRPEIEPRRHFLSVYRFSEHIEHPA